MDKLLQKLQACIDDPMWPDHTEISKATLREVVALLAPPDAARAPTDEALTDAQIKEAMLAAFPLTKCSPAYIKFARNVERMCHSTERVERKPEAVVAEDAGTAWVATCPYCIRTLHIIKKS